MSRLRLAVSVPDVHSVLISACAWCGDVTTGPVATTEMLIRQATRPRIEQG